MKPQELGGFTMSEIAFALEVGADEAVRKNQSDAEIMRRLGLAAALTPRERLRAGRNGRP